MAKGSLFLGDLPAIAKISAATAMATAQAGARHRSRLSISSSSAIRNSWETPGNYSRLFSFEIGADGKLAGGLDMDGDGAETLIGNTPSKPSGGGEEIAWSADSQKLYFALRKADAAEPRSTDLDIYASEHGLGDPKNLTPDDQATDTLPPPHPTENGWHGRQWRVRVMRLTSKR